MTTGWKAHGMAWALGDALTSEGKEWTLEDVARAYEAGAHRALVEQADGAGACQEPERRRQRLGERDRRRRGAGMKDTLIALVERGPLWDGDVPSKIERDELLDKGLAVRVVVRGEDGWQAATYQGRDEYRAMFGDADTLSEARANRIAARAIRRAST